MSPPAHPSSFSFRTLDQRSRSARRSASGSVVRAASSRMPAKAGSTRQRPRRLGMSARCWGVPFSSRWGDGHKFRPEPIQGLFAPSLARGGVGQRLVLAPAAASQRGGAGRLVAILRLADRRRARVGRQTPRTRVGPMSRRFVGKSRAGRTRRIPRCRRAGPHREGGREAWRPGRSSVGPCGELDPARDGGPPRPAGSGPLGPAGAGRLGRSSTASRAASNSPRSAAPEPGRPARE